MNDFNQTGTDKSFGEAYERVLNLTYVAYKNAFSSEMQFWSHCFHIKHYQALDYQKSSRIPCIPLGRKKKTVFLLDTWFRFPD